MDIYVLRVKLASHGLFGAKPLIKMGRSGAPPKGPRYQM